MFLNVRVISKVVHVTYLQKVIGIVIINRFGVNDVVADMAPGKSLKYLKCR